MVYGSRPPTRGVAPVAPLPFRASVRTRRNGAGATVDAGAVNVVVMMSKPRLSRCLVHFAPFDRFRLPECRLKKPASFPVKAENADGVFSYTGVASRDPRASCASRVIYYGPWRS